MDLARRKDKEVRPALAGLSDVSLLANWQAGPLSIHRLSFWMANTGHLPWHISALWTARTGLPAAIPYGAPRWVPSIGVRRETVSVRLKKRPSFEESRFLWF